MDIDFRFSTIFNDGDGCAVGFGEGVAIVSLVDTLLFVIFSFFLSFSINIAIVDIATKVNDPSTMPVITGAKVTPETRARIMSRMIIAPHPGPPDPL